MKENGLEVAGDVSFRFDGAGLTANFRTAPALVEELGKVFERVFESDDGSGVLYTPVSPARETSAGEEQAGSRLKLHLEFAPRMPRGRESANDDVIAERDRTRESQTNEIVALIAGCKEKMEVARVRKGKYRIAVLGRANKHLAPIAHALRQAGIRFRAVGLEELADRPEVLDVLALGRALLNPYDRVSWLGVLRAPWCGLALDTLHLLVSADDPELMDRTVPELLAEEIAAAGRRRPGARGTGNEGV